MMAFMMLPDALVYLRRTASTKIDDQAKRTKGVLL
jgi:hypothetical protein